LYVNSPSKCSNLFDSICAPPKEVSKIISDYVSEKYNWSSISKQWKTLIDTITGDTMTTENTALTYAPIDAQKAVVDDEYFVVEFEN
jgi:hypothetical protein